MKKLACFAVFMGVCLSFAAAEEPSALPPELEQKAAACEAAVAALSPDDALSCAKDEAFINRLAVLDAQRASNILEKGYALIELAKLLDKHGPGREQEATLRATLSCWLAGLPYATMGLATPAEIIGWVQKYRPAYGQARLVSLRKVLLEWDSLPSQDVSQSLSNAGISKDQKKVWAGLTLAARENMLVNMAVSVLDRFSRSGDCMSEDLRSAGIWGFLPPDEEERFNLYVRKCYVMDKVKDKMRGNRKLQLALASVKGQPLDVQIYKLSKFFDNNDSPLAREIEALREPTPSETIAPEQNLLLSSVLQSSVLGFLRGVPAGDEIVKFYAPGAGNDFKLKIEDMAGDTAEYRPSTGEIVINSRLLQQFMRINGYAEGKKFYNFTTSDLLTNKNGAMRHLVNFIAPVVVHEAAHQMQHKWASSRNIFDPYSKEDEVEAIAKQSLFVLQKYGKDPAFRKLVDQDKEYSSYMALNVQLADEFERDPSRFLQRVGDIYYPKIPPAQAAYTYSLAVIDQELDRRRALPEEAQHGLESGSLKREDALNMTNSGLRENVDDFSTADLKALRDSILANRQKYVERREQVVGEALDALRAMGSKQ